MEAKSFKAWAIHAHSEEGHSLLGPYWWFDGCAPEIVDHMKGCQIAIFKTRKEARKRLPRCRETFPNAQVERIKIAIEVTEKP